MTPDGLVALYGFNYESESEPGSRHSSYSVLFDIRSPVTAMRLDGVLADLTDERLLTSTSFDLAGPVLHDYSSPPVRFSADGCTTLSGDANTGGELVVDGAAVHLGTGEKPLAVSSDASATLIAGGAVGTDRIRRLDIDAPDVVLAGRFNIAFFIDG